MVPNNMDALEWLRKHLDAEGSDLLREMVKTCAERLMGVQVPRMVCGPGRRVLSRGADGRVVSLVTERRAVKG